MKNIKNLAKEFENADERILRAIETHLETAFRYCEELEGKGLTKEDFARKVKALRHEIMCFDAITDQCDKVPELLMSVRLKLVQRSEILMAQNGITEDDVEKCDLYLTSTGRKTASPQFKRRFD